MEGVSITMECRVLLRSPEEVEAARAREETPDTDEKEPD